MNALIPFTIPVKNETESRIGSSILLLILVSNSTKSSAIFFNERIEYNNPPISFIIPAEISSILRIVFEAFSSTGKVFCVRVFISFSMLLIDFRSLLIAEIK